MLLQEIVDGSSADIRIETLSNEYRAFCRKEKLTLHMRKFDKHTFGGGGSTEPSGAWNKAAVTSSLMLFLEWACGQRSEDVMNDERLR